MFPFADMRMRNIMTPSAPLAQQSDSTPIAAGGIGMNQNIGLIDQPAPAASISDILNATDFANNPPKEGYQIPGLSDEMAKKLQEALDMMPQRGDYKPSKFRKIIASVASVGAKDPEEQQRVISEIQDKPYNQDMQDWLTHVGALMKGATVEEQRNINARLIGLGIIKANQGDVKLGQGQQKLDQGQQKLDIENATSQARIDHLKWLEEHPDWKPLQTKGGNRILYNPKDPTQTHDTGVPVGSSTDVALENLRQKGREAIANIRAAAEIAAAKERGAQARETKAAPGTKNETSQQKKVRLYNRAQQALNEHPEWKDYIQMDPQGRTGSFEVVAPSAGWFASDATKKTLEDTRDAIYDYIYNEQVPTNEQPTKSGNIKSIVEVPKKN